MPTGKVEKYRIVLQLDRLQRKLLDRLEKACHHAVSHAVRHGLHRLEDLKLVTPLDEFEKIVEEFLKDANPPFFHETKKEIARRANEVYASIVAGDISDHKGRSRALLIVVPADQVVFSSSGKQVRVPYLGVVGYKGNQKAVPFGANGGIYVPQKAYQATLGYHNQEPCLMLGVLAPKKAETSNFGSQKLVRVTASEIAHRKKAPGTPVPPNPERK
jgi:hypothetical protein